MARKETEIKSTKRDQRGWVALTNKDESIVFIGEKIENPLKVLMRAEKLV